MKPKKKNYSKQTAVFYQIEDALRWEDYVKHQGCEQVEVLAKFN